MNRRSLIKSIAAGSLTSTAPLTMLLGRAAMAAENDRPIRTIFLFHPNGAVPSHFFPAPGTMNLPKMTKPLESVKQHLLFLDGIGYGGPAGGHEGGSAKCLTGYTGTEEKKGSQGLSSIEVILGEKDWANRANTGVIVPSLQMGVATKWGDSVMRRISFKGNQDLHAVDDPRILYPQIFGSVNSGGSSATSVLATVKDDLNRLKTRLGSVERARLDLHADSMSILEQKIKSQSNVSGAACPGRDISSVVGTNKDMTLWATGVLENLSDIQQDLAVQALACNVTRTMVFAYGVAVSPIVVPGTSMGDHDLSHQDADAHSTSKVWWMAQIGKFIDKLAKTPDGRGSLLDNTIICTVSDLGHGNHHSHNRIPMFLAGGKNVGLVTGRSVDLRPYGTQQKFGGFSDTKIINHTDVLTTIAEKAGYTGVKLPTTRGRINNLWVGGNAP